MTKYTMEFCFPYDRVTVRGLDAETYAAYAEKMRYEVPFEVEQKASDPDYWPATDHEIHIINPNMVTYVKVIEVKSTT